MASFHRIKHKDGSLGDIVQCSHDPCTLHGDMDIQANSLEEAYQKLYDTDNHGYTDKSVIHPRINRKMFSVMKKTAVPFLMVALMSSLSACGSGNTGYDNSGILDSPSSSISSTPSSSTSESSSPKIDKQKIKDYSSKAKGKYESVKGRVERYLDDMENSDANSSSSSGTSSSGVPASLAANTNVGMSDLKSLKVVPDHGRSSSYNRREWSNSSFAAYGSVSCWSVRDEVIKRQADPGTLRISPDGCSVEAVSFTDPYSGKKITEDTKQEVAKNIQIDHMVPVSYIDSNGGEAWPSSLKDSYYNDMDPGYLIAVSSDENSLKSDYGPSNYLPTAGAKYQLAYAQDWVSVLKRYASKGANATIEQSDYNTIMNIFDQNGVS